MQGIETRNIHILLNMANSVLINKEAELVLLLIKENIGTE